MLRRLFSLPILHKATGKASELLRDHFRALFPDHALLERLERSHELSIEVTNICNANCTFCAYQYQERPRRMMDDETFRKALEGFVALGGSRLGIGCLVGDPLLDPHFLERVRLARSYSCVTEVVTTTNCIHLDKVGARALLASGLTSIVISTTGFDEEMYRRLYRSSHYARMKRNLLELLRTNHEMGRPANIHIGLRIDRPAREVLANPEFQEARTLADGVSWNTYFDSWSGRIRPEDLSGNMKVRPNWYRLIKHRLPCRQLWLGTMVLVDGTVTACGCRDLNGDSDLVLGNIHETPLPQLLRSAQFSKLKQDWQTGRYVPNICRDCSHYQPYVSLAEE